MSTPESSPEEMGSSTSIPLANAANSEDRSNPKPTNGEFLASSSSLKSSAKIFLKPSALSAQTKQLMKPEENSKHSENTKWDVTEDQAKSPQATSPTTTTPQLFVPRDKPTAQFPGLLAATSSATVHGPNIIGSGSFKAFVPDEATKDGGNGFVFGSNLHDRALNYDPAAQENGQLTSIEQTARNRNLTFENAADLKDLNSKKPVKALTDYAKEYEMMKRPQVKLEEVDVITGEEDESNVLQMNCKLFVFDKTEMNWQEKGRAVLRLNDQEDGGVVRSRLIMRVQGSLSVISNTKVWSGMKLKRHSQKTLQFSAFDVDEGVKVYLVIAGATEVEQLFNALDCRITELMHQETVSSATKTGNLNAPALDNDDSSESSPKKRFKVMHPEDGSAE